jgi:predicted nuclease with TOPRIM domain
MDMKEIDRLSTALKSRTELIDKLKEHIRVLGSENNKLSELFDASGIDNNILHERIKVLSDEVYEAVKRARETEEALSAANERIKALVEAAKYMITCAPILNLIAIEKLKAALAEVKGG